MTVRSEADRLAREDQLAWKLAAVATGPVAVEPAVAEMIINRVIDNAAVAIAFINRHPVVSARMQALAHPRLGGAAVFGCGPEVRVHAEWGAWANGTAVRELDYHDTLLAAEYSHPGDDIPPILAVAQQLGLDGATLVRGIATGYEIQVDLARSVCLHKHKIDHVAHPSPQGSGPCSASKRQPSIRPCSRRSTSPPPPGKAARARSVPGRRSHPPTPASSRSRRLDRAMLGEGAPSPIYEGEDGVIAWMLDGKDARYVVDLPEPGEPKRAVLDTYTKEHSAEYQSRALIDLAFEPGKCVADWDEVAEILIETSHHTHYVIGTGANDPQKMDPNASRETLDHSIMYIVAVALQDGAWHHARSYAPQRAARPDTVALWHKIRTVEDPRWTKRYHADDAATKAFGGRVIIRLKDDSVIEGELAVANAQSLGATPWQRADYVRKFETLTAGLLDPNEAHRFLRLVQELSGLRADQIASLNVTVPAGTLKASPAHGLFSGRHLEGSHERSVAETKEVRRPFRRAGWEHRALHRRPNRQRPA